MNKYHRYVFNGAVCANGVELTRWKTSTVAVSDAAAINNLKYRFRKENPYASCMYIVLCGDLKRAD